MASLPHFSSLPIYRCVFFISAALLLSGCSEPEAPPPAPAVPVSVVSLKATEVRPHRDFVARTAASAKADLVARIEAEIKQILFVEGSKVKQNQVLIKLEDTRVKADFKQAKAELSSASSELNSASRNLERGNDVAGRGYLSDADLDKLKDRFNLAQSRLEAAKAGVQRAQTNLDYTVITAPFEGWIGRQNYDVGAIVSPASGPITDVMVSDPIYVEFQLDEAGYLAFRRASQLSKGNLTSQLSLALTLPGGEHYDQNGKLSFTDVQTDALTGTVAMRAVFPNPDAVLLPGLYVTLQIKGVAGASQVLVPQVAIQETIEGKFVLVVDEQNKVGQRFIKTGARVGAMLATLSGLEVGELVIVEGLQKVRAGVVVNPVVKIIEPQTGVFSELDLNADEAQ